MLYPVVGSFLGSARVGSKKKRRRPAPISARDGNGCAKPSKRCGSCGRSLRPAIRARSSGFPPCAAIPSPSRKAGPSILLGAHGPKALERVARTYDGWCPVAGKPESFKRDVAELRRLAAAQGRNPDSLRIMAFVSPSEDGILTDTLKLYAEMGVERLCCSRNAMRSQWLVDKPSIIHRLAPTVERAQHL